MRTVLLALLYRKLMRSRLFLRIAQRLPAWALGGHRWITRPEDAREAMQRTHDFGMPYLRRMEELGVPFILGLNPSPDYHRHRAAMEQAVDGVDLGRLCRATAACSEEALSACGGEIDLVRGLTHPVLARTGGEALWSAPLTVAQVELAVALWHDIFANPLENPDVRRAAEAAVPRLRGFADGLIAARRADPLGREDVLGRLLQDDRWAGGLEGDELVQSLLGLLVAWVISTTRAMACAFDRLLAPESAAQLARAQAAARERDLAAVGEILLEALRFRPAMPALERVCLRQTRLAGRRMDRGDRLMVVLTALMMQDPPVSDPDAFRPGRPGSQYLHFGYPSRTCVGRHVARSQMEAMAAALLRRPGVRRTSPLRMSGPYPKQLTVAFDDGAYHARV